MKQQIIKIMKKIEQEHNVKILFAIESGSRLWRMESTNSDYDIRFVYVQKIKEYLSLDTQRIMNDVIERKLGDIDMVGFDIFKFGHLIYVSNPTVLEWLQSDIIYHGKIPKDLVEFMLENFNPLALFFHYQNMAKYNYEKYVHGQNQVSRKKYLYVMRGILSANYVKKYNKVPLLKFEELLDNSFFESEIPIQIYVYISAILQQKRKRTENNTDLPIQELNDYIEQKLKEYPEIEPRVLDRNVINRWIQSEVI